MAAIVTPAHVAGVLAVLIGFVDHALLHDAFGLQWDQALVLGGITFLAGVAVPSPLNRSVVTTP